jgi:hypothetical protein
MQMRAKLLPATPNLHMRMEYAEVAVNHAVLPKIGVCYPLRTTNSMLITTNRIKNRIRIERRLRLLHPLHLLHRVLLHDTIVNVYIA